MDGEWIPGMSYFQAIPMCANCWDERNPDRKAIRLNDAELEICGWCGAIQSNGIYVRADIRSIPYPSQQAE